MRGVLVPMMVPIYMVRAFTTKEKNSGNPAAVIIQEECDKHGLLTSRGKPAQIDEASKQKIAAEMNLSETAFVSDARDVEEKSVITSDHFKLQWFTPTNQVSLCGHATLATAAALYAAGNQCQTLTFTTLSGELQTRRDQDGKITLDFPLNPSKPVGDDEVVREIVAAVVGGLSVQAVEFSPTTQKLLVRLHDKHTRSDLQGIRVRAEHLLCLPNQAGDMGSVRGVVVTVRGGGGGDHYHFLSRMFAPWNGIPEDPVTGSAHTVLGDYWHHQLGRDKMIAHQASARGGDLYLTWREDGRIEISGESQLVYRGVYFL